MGCWRQGTVWIHDYLLNYRLQWGKPDGLSLMSPNYDASAKDQASLNSRNSPRKGLPPLPSDAPPYFTSDIPSEYLSIILNDWPYSVPPEVEHSLIWSHVPIFHLDIIPESIRKRVEQDGLWGFTGNSEHPPSPSTLPSCIDALSEWGITLDNMITSERGTDEEETMIQRAGKEIDTFIKNRWAEEIWETAWFVNPPRLQSVPELSHIHVFARNKTVQNAGVVSKSPIIQNVPPS
ncbi:hypothetical protein AX17_006209 [Amanita inopinata Kibby_2008]|nr:hypothetical protein AX17_006209 [Amanita inopinata Kibby_2008]